MERFWKLKIEMATFGAGDFLGGFFWRATSLAGLFWLATFLAGLFGLATFWAGDFLGGDFCGRVPGGSPPAICWPARSDVHIARDPL